jgi:hypothetical protein
MLNLGRERYMNFRRICSSHALGSCQCDIKKKIYQEILVLSVNESRILFWDLKMVNL